MNLKMDIGRFYLNTIWGDAHLIISVTNSPSGYCCLSSESLSGVIWESDMYDSYIISDVIPDGYTLK